MDEMLEKSNIDFSKEPTLSPEDLEILLKSIPLDPEEPDPETNYYNKNKSKIRTHIEKGLFDPEILRYGNVVTNFINDDIDLELYEEYVKQYCAAKGIDYEKYINERQSKINELSKASPAPKKADSNPRTNHTDDHFDYSTWRKERLKVLSDTFDFTKNQPLSMEEIQAALTHTEEDGPLPDPANISREIFAKALKSGEVDPALLTKDVFDKLLKSRLFEYNLFEVVYCD